MDGVWLTYAEIAERMGKSAEAARQRAIRKRWRRQVGNDGLARVFVPADVELTPVRTRNEQASERPKSGRADPVQTPSVESELLARLAAVQDELVAMAQKLATAEARAGIAEAEIASAKSAMDELRQDRDVWRARAERLTTAEGRADAAEERAGGLQAILDVERRRSDELHQERDRLLGQLADERRERDQALERLNLNIDRFEQAQAAHVDELLALREQMAVVAHDRDRAAEALAVHLALPWWRRLFA